MFEFLLFLLILIVVFKFGIKLLFPMKRHTIPFEEWKNRQEEMAKDLKEN